MIREHIARIGIVGRLLTIVAAAAVAGGAVVALGFSRDSIQYAIERRYPLVRHIDAATFEKLDRNEVAIFDRFWGRLIDDKASIRLEPDAVSSTTTGPTDR